MRVRTAQGKFFFFANFRLRNLLKLTPFGRAKILIEKHRVFLPEETQDRFGGKHNSWEVRRKSWRKISRE